MTGRTLPPLAMLRAIEALDRLGTVTRTADALGLSQPAVSQKLKQLEEWLDAELFVRGGRRITLSEEGRFYAGVVRDALSQLEAAGRRVSARRTGDTLTISALPSVAQRWLLPRLPRLRERLPGVQLVVHSSYDHVDFARDAIDAVIKFGLNNYPGGDGDFLGHETMFPVVSPAYRDRAEPLDTPADLTRHPLLQTFDLKWADWLHLAGVTGVDLLAIDRLSDPAMVIGAALSGQGVSLARRLLVADELAAGTLVQPFDLELDHPHSYWLVTPHGLRDTPRVAALRDWLHAEFAAQRLASSSRTA